MRKEARDHDFKELAGDEREARLKDVLKQKISIHLNLAAAHLKRFMLSAQLCAPLRLPL